MLVSASVLLNACTGCQEEFCPAKAVMVLRNGQSQVVRYNSELTGDRNLG